MLRSMDSAVAGLRAHQNKMDVIGNNISNVNTFGFKSQTYSFKEAMYQTSTASTGGVVRDTTSAGGTNAAQYGYGTMMGSIAMDMTSSTPSYVGGFNACIDGEGFFITKAVVGPDAGYGVDKMKASGFDYTRVGQFQIDSNGYLVDANKNFVYGFRRRADDTDAKPLEDNLKPLKVPKDLKFAYDGDALQLKDVQVNSAGEVTGTVVSTDAAQDGKTVSLGKVAIATFQNPNGLTKSGGGYYNASDSDNTGASSATIPGGSTSMLMTGYLEASNVDLAKEFSEMITTQRGFQANSKIITVSDEMLADLVNMKR